jgi:pimeloyl-ACP methyl ester carboxylesterase
MTGPEEFGKATRRIRRSARTAVCTTGRFEVQQPEGPSLKHRLPQILALCLSLLLACTQTHAAAVDTLTLAELRAKYQLPNSRYVNLDGVDLHYVDEGVGQPVVLLHASYMGLRSWDGIASRLKSDFRVVRLDFPNAGLSGPETKPVPPGKFDLIERNHEILVRFVEKLGLDRFALVGTSSGGSVAFRYAARKADRVQRLVLINSAGMPRTPQTDPLRERPEFIEWSKMLVKPREFWALSLTQTFIHPNKAPEWLVDQEYDFRRREGLEQTLVDDYVFTTGDTETILAGVRAPTLIMWGKANPIVMHLEADVFAFWMTGAPTVIRKLEGLGHYPYIEDEQAVFPDFVAFLGGGLDDQLRRTIRVKPDTLTINRN